MLDFFILNIMVSILEDSFQSFKMTRESKINIFEMIKQKFSSKGEQKVAKKYSEKDSLKDLSNQINRLLEYFAKVRDNNLNKFSNFIHLF
jgi:hypothetical protein